MYDKQQMIIICDSSQAAMCALAEQLREVSGMEVTVQTIDTESCFNGQQYEQLGADELRKRLAASMYEAAPQQYKIREGGKGRNKGKHNREWWNK